METVRIAFSNSNKIFSRLIRCMTWSKWSHVAILDDEKGTAIEAIGSGVREVPLREFLHEKRRVEIVTVYVLDKTIAIDFARAQVGKKYDFSALFGIFFKRDWEETDKWFCSELVTAALNSCKSSPFRSDLTGRITPGDLWKVNPKRLPI